MTSLNLHGLSVSIKSNNKKFVSFIRASLENHLISETNEPHIMIDMCFNNKSEYEKKIKDRKPTEYFGSNLYYEKTKLYWDTKKLKILIDSSKETYHITCYSTLRLDQKIRKLFKKDPEFENNHFLYLYRFVVLYPIMAKLSNSNNFSVIHSAAIYDKKKNRAILFIGLNGVGKSTLAFELQKQERFSLLSDNFVFIKGNEVFQVPELIRLPKNLNLNYDEDLLLGKANNKLLLKDTPPSNLPNKILIGDIVFVSRDIKGTTSKLIQIKKEQALFLLNQIGYYLKEYENFQYSGFLEKNKNDVDSNNYSKLIQDTNNYTYKIGNEKNSSVTFLQLFEG